VDTRAAGFDAELEVVLAAELDDAETVSYFQHVETTRDTHVLTSCALRGLTRMIAWVWTAPLKIVADSRNLNVSSMLGDRHEACMVPGGQLTCRH